MKKSDKLNLGCGDYPKEGFLNVDFNSKKADLNYNLEHFPYPFENNAFKLIELDHVLEHLSQPFAVMAELYRISAPGARIRIRVPHFSRGFTHPDHKRGFDITFPFYFNSNMGQFFYGTPLKCERVHLEWYAQPYVKKKILSPFIHYPLYFLSKFINFSANLSSMFASRIWCYWVGGFEEIEFIFQVEK